MSTYKIIEYKGKKVRQYEDGAIRDSNGRLLKLHPKTVDHMITSENASEYNRRRWQKYQEEAANGVAEELGASLPGATTPLGAWRVLNGRLAAQIIDSDKPRGRDLEYLGRNMGAIPTQMEAESVEKPSDNSIRSVLSDIATIAKAMSIDNVDAKCSYLKQDSTAVLDGSVVDDDAVKKDSEDKSGGGG